jgi:hypothetical protein
LGGVSALAQAASVDPDGERGEFRQALGHAGSQTPPAPRMPQE